MLHTLGHTLGYVSFFANLFFCGVWAQSFLITLHTDVYTIHKHTRSDYLSVIAQPMDLTTLINMLNVGDVRDAQQFLDLAITIFQNAIDYNSRHQGEAHFSCDAIFVAVMLTVLGTGIELQIHCEDLPPHACILTSFVVRHGV